MELSFEEISDVINEILIGKKIVEIGNEVSIFVQPNGLQKLQASYIEKKAIKKYSDQGIFLESEIPDHVLQNFFSLSDEEELQSLLVKLKAFETLLEKRVPNTSLYEKEYQRIQNLKKDINNLKYKKTVSSEYSAEFLAREDKNLYLLSECVLNLDGNRRWNTIDDLLSANLDYVYRYVINYFNFYHGPEVKVLRKVARSNQWRALFLAAKRIGSVLFKCDSADLSIPQVQLISWSFYYDNIYELPLHERPEDDVIEDDDRLDKFLERYMKHVKAEAAELSSKRVGARKSDSQDEQIITASDPRYIQMHKKQKYSDPKKRKGANK